MKKILFTLFFFIPFISFSNETPTRVYYGVYVKNLMLEERAKEKSNRFSADIYWWMKYTMPEDSSLIGDIENIEFINAEVHENETVARTFFYDSLTKEQMVYVTGHMTGEFMFYPNYHYYPMDKLLFPIIIESKNLISQEIQLIADTNSYEKVDGKILGISEDIEIPGFKIREMRFKNAEKIYETNFGDSRFQTHLNYSRVRFEIIVARKSSLFLFKILVPIVLITLMAYLVFFVPASQLEVAVGLTVTSLLSCIALQLTLSSEIPVTGYLIASDKIFYLSYFLITLAMIQTVYTYNLQKKGKERLANKYEKLARWVYPLIFITVVLFVIISGSLSGV